MIFDFRFSIFDYLARRSTQSRFTAGDKNRGKFVRFIQKWFYASTWQQLAFNRDLEPKCALVSFFFDNGGFVDKIGSRLRAAESAIIRTYRATAAHQLTSNKIAGSRVWEGIYQFENSERKLLCAIFHPCFVHAALLNRKSRIENRK